jgi:hypothetical protein
MDLLTSDAMASINYFIYSLTASASVTDLELGVISDNNVRWNSTRP